MSDTKYIDIKDFREKGYLFEANRQFFHPLGLALEIRIDDEGNEVLGGVWDYRSDPEGILYDEKTVTSKKSFDKALRVNVERAEKEMVRKKKYGFGIQPVAYSSLEIHKEVRLKEENIDAKLFE
ncbi:hypothetical protein [Paenibacillus sp. O199]|uniref:hypothetical protein n=1 Tax=Paenibacillus sp. O199 TaxID=1643925 RepID=UPI0007BF0EC4|nr:hypothetical protein [Paenibacillus sp. O199]